MIFFLVVTRSLPIKYNVHPDFVSSAPFLQRLTYAFFSIQAARPKFYFAWTLGKPRVCNSVVVNHLPADEMRGTLLHCYSNNHMPCDSFLSLHRLSWCSKQCCRLWFLGDGWKWKAILGPHLQHQHLGDWGTLSVSDNSTVYGHLLLYSISCISPAMTEWSDSYSYCWVFFQTATSFKTFIDNWNIRTGIWLKT